MKFVLCGLWFSFWAFFSLLIINYSGLFDIAFFPPATIGCVIIAFLIGGKMGKDAIESSNFTILSQLILGLAVPVLSGILTVICSVLTLSILNLLNILENRTLSSYSTIETIFTTLTSSFLLIIPGLVILIPLFVVTIPAGITGAISLVQFHRIFSTRK